MSYVMLQPHSSTNGTDLYRVAEYNAWVDFAFGTATTYPWQERASAVEAQALCDQLNAEQDASDVPR